MLQLIQNILGFISALSIFFGTYGDIQEMGWCETLNFETGESSGENKMIKNKNKKLKYFRIVGVSLLGLSFSIGIFSSFEHLLKHFYL